MQNMYPGQVNSPATALSSAINNTATSIEVVNGELLPIAPNITTIGRGENAETILYTSKIGNVISGITRGFQGIAQSWPQGTQIARQFTAYDYDALRENIEDNSNQIGSVSTDLETHLAEEATLTHRGHVMLSSSIDSENEEIAATTKAVKSVNDKINNHETTNTNLIFQHITRLNEGSTNSNTPISDFPFGKSIMRVGTDLGFPVVAGTLETTRTTTGTGYQLFISTTLQGPMYVRQTSGGVWQPWVEILTNSAIKTTSLDQGTYNLIVTRPFEIFRCRNNLGAITINQLNTDVPAGTRVLIVKGSNSTNSITIKFSDTNIRTPNQVDIVLNANGYQAVEIVRMDIETAPWHVVNVQSANPY